MEAESSKIARRLNSASFRVVLVSVSWAIGYGAPWLASAGSGSAWLQMSAWAAKHGLGSLESSSRWVTVAVTLTATLGALIRVTRIGGRQSRIARQIGFFLTCAALCVVLPVPGAVFYLLIVVLVSMLGLAETESNSRSALWTRLLQESFSVLAAGCFLTMSWQYNAQALTRSLLVAAGVALMLRAALPRPSISLAS